MSETPQCPYATLSVSTEATDDEIKKAYRKLAVVHHPDKNQGSVESTQMFQRISAAYAVLSDPEKREHYDRTGSLDPEDMAGPDMDDLMQMFFSNFGGGMVFGGHDMFYDFGGGRGHPFMRGGGFGGFGGHVDPFDDFFDEFDDEFDSMDEEELMEEEFMEVVPALFCSKFIDIQQAEPTAASSQTAAGAKKKKTKETYKCTLCEAVMKTPDSAENHFINTHTFLMEVFLNTLMEFGIDADVEELFEEFAEEVKNGKISEKKKKKKKRNKRKTAAKGPKVKAPTTSSN